MSENPVVLLETTSGDILVELYPDKAPETVANFLKYVDDGFYNNTIFHRVIPGFMIPVETITSPYFLIAGCIHTGCSVKPRTVSL